MAISAFGVEHGDGDIAKALRMPGMLKPARLGQQMGNKVAGLSKPLGQSANRSFGQGRSLTGNVQMRLGQGAKRLGRGMQNNPGAAGALGLGAAGGGAAGAAGFSSFGGNRRRH